MGKKKRERERRGDNVSESFAFLFVLRALSKRLWEKEEECTFGSPKDDAHRGKKKDGTTLFFFVVLSPTSSPLPSSPFLLPRKSRR